jgi:hypothetical protein
MSWIGFYLGHNLSLWQTQLDCESVTLLSRYSNHHEKEHETAEKNKRCHLKSFPHRTGSLAE